MQRYLGLSVALALFGAATAQAGGIDRSGQPIDAIFQDGNYAELGFSRTLPSVSGTDVRQANGYASGKKYSDVADNFDIVTFALKYDVTENVSVTLMGGEDYGVDVDYASELGSLLGGTYAWADSYTVSLIGRYKFNEVYSVHGGIRYQTAKGGIGLGDANPAIGLAYGAVSGYEVDLDSSEAWGWLAGVAYERPEIALRVALTYFSAIEHSFTTTETLSGASLGTSGKTDVKTPQAVNLDFQTGVAKDTLVFANIHWAEHSQFEVEPEKFTALTGTGLVTLDDSTTYTIGVGHRFTEQVGASVAYIWDQVDGDDLVSPLAPTHGSQALRVGARYTMANGIELLGGVRYTWLGDAYAQTRETKRAEFKNNEAVSVALKVAYRF